jgi:hypothetical protein
MLKNNELVGIINIFRQEVRPFSDKQVALLTSFAQQAVIAIENTRLLNELRESLQQQTAASEVLNVISRSTFDAQPVFETIIKNAARLCQSVLSAIYRSDGELVHLVAHDHFSPESVAAVQAAYPVPVPSSNLIAVALVVSLNRPGGNATGVNFFTAELVAKRCVAGAGARRESYCSAGQPDRSRGLSGDTARCRSGHWRPATSAS